MKRRPPRFVVLPAPTILDGLEILILRLRFTGRVS